MGISFKKPSFAAGELSERMHSRDDLERYHIGLQTCRNWRVLKEGGVEKTPGFRYLGRAKYGDRATRVVELERDADTVNALEFGDRYVRIWKDRYNVLQPATVTGADRLQIIGSTFVWVASASGTNEWYLTSQHGGPPDIFGEPADLRRFTPPSAEVTRSPGAIGSLAVGEWGWGDNDELGFPTIYVRDLSDPTDWVGLGYRYTIPGPLEYATPYLPEQIHELDFDSEGSFLYIFHEDHPPAQLVRTSDTEWEYSAINFDAAGEPVESYAFPAGSPPAALVGTPEWTIEYALTRLSEGGVESAKRTVNILSQDQPDPASPPPLGTVGPVWTLESTELGDERNIVIAGSDYEWLNALAYSGDDVWGRNFGYVDEDAEYWFLAKKGTGLDGPAGGSTNLAQDPGIFADSYAAGPVEVFDVTGGVALGINRLQRRGGGIITGWEGFEGRGYWAWGVAPDALLVLQDGGGPLFWATNIAAFPTLWRITGTRGALADPNFRDLELTVEVDAGYNLYRRFAKINGVEGYATGGTWFPWGRLSALDAYGGVLLAEPAAPPGYEDPSAQRSKIVGAYLDTGDVTPDETREPPEVPKLFAAPRRYPAAGGFLGQRFALGGSLDFPNRINLSVTGDFYDFVASQSVDDSDPIERDLTTGNRIIYMIETGNGSMLVFTSGGEWRVWGQGGPVTPSTINAASGENYGCRPGAKPLKIAGQIVWATKLGKAVRSMQYDIARDSFASRGISVISEHLIETYPIAGWCYAETPNKTIYAYRTDGTVVGITFDPEQQMNAWWRRDTANGEVRSLASIRTAERDEVWAVVRREINGETVQYIEVMESGDSKDQPQACFVDSAISLSTPSMIATSASQAGPIIQIFVVNTLEVGDEIVISGMSENRAAYRDVPAVTVPGGAFGLALNGLRARVRARSDVAIQLEDIDTGADLGMTGLGTYLGVDFTVRKLVKNIYGLDHLEGQTVAVYADGRDRGTAVVTDARLTLETGAADLVIGLPIVSELELLDFSGTAGDQTLDRRAKNPTGVTVDMLRTQGLKVGISPDRLVDMKLRTPRHWNSRTAPPLFTGKESVVPRGEWADTAHLYFRHDSPYPATIRSCTPEYELGD